MNAREKAAAESYLKNEFCKDALGIRYGEDAPTWVWDLADRLISMGWRKEESA